jgi:hypothetical protein
MGKCLRGQPGLSGCIHTFSAAATGYERARLAEPLQRKGLRCVITAETPSNTVTGNQRIIQKGME